MLFLRRLEFCGPPFADIPFADGTLRTCKKWDIFEPIKNRLLRISLLRTCKKMGYLQIKKKKFYFCFCGYIRVF